MGTQLAPSTDNHPQTDGQSERANRIITQIIRAYIQGCEKDWDRLLTPIEFVYNNSVQESTQQTPFILDNGRNPSTPLSVTTGSRDHNPAAANFMQTFQDYHEKAKTALLKAQTHQKKYADQHRRELQLHQGQSVLLSSKYLSSAHQHAKSSNQDLLGHSK